MREEIVEEDKGRDKEKLNDKERERDETDPHQRRNEGGRRVSW